MKKELIHIAKQKGFKSKLFTDEPWKYSTKESMRYELWLYELYNWILKTNIILIKKDLLEYMCYFLLNDNNILKSYFKAKKLKKSKR